MQMESRELYSPLENGEMEERKGIERTARGEELGKVHTMMTIIYIQ